jgi:hypothetical protein
VRLLEPIEGVYHAKRAFPSVESGPTHHSRRALTSAESWTCSALSAFSLRSNQDRRIALGVCLPRPTRGLAPRQAVFLFGQIRTDASLQACAYSGRIVASLRVKRFSSSVKSGPTHRSRCALTPAESWPRPRQAVFLFGQVRTDASLQACAYSGRIVASLRVKRFSSSVKSISDRLGARAQGDPCLGCHLLCRRPPRRLGPAQGGGLASTEWRKHSLKRK